MRARTHLSPKTPKPFQAVDTFGSLKEDGGHHHKMAEGGVKYMCAYAYMHKNGRGDRK